MVALVFNSCANCLRRRDVRRGCDVHFHRPVENFMRTQIVGHGREAGAAGTAVQFPCHREVEARAAEQHRGLVPVLAFAERRMTSCSRDSRIITLRPVQQHHVKIFHLLRRDGNFRERQRGDVAKVFLKKRGELFRARPDVEHALGEQRRLGGRGQRNEQDEAAESCPKSFHSLNVNEAVPASIELSRSDGKQKAGGNLSAGLFFEFFNAAR